MDEEEEILQETTIEEETIVNDAADSVLSDGTDDSTDSSDYSYEEPFNMWIPEDGENIYTLNENRIDATWEEEHNAANMKTAADNSLEINHTTCYLRTLDEINAAASIGNYYYHSPKTYPSDVIDRIKTLGYEVREEEDNTTIFIWGPIDF